MPYVTTETPVQTGAMSRYPYSEALEKLYTFVTKYEETVRMAVRVENFLDVPRSTCPLGKIDTRAYFPPQPFAHKIIPRDDQGECIARSLELLRADANHLLEAPTGWGKCYAGVAIACELGQPTLIAIQKTDLKRNWLKALRAAGIPESEIGIAQGKDQSWRGKRYVIGMVQTMMVEDKMPQAFWDQFGLLICDEVHHMAAERFSYVMTRAKARNRLGLSATPKRKDGKNPMIFAHIGPVRVYGEVFPVKPEVIVKPTLYRLPSESYTKKDGTQGLRPLRPPVPGRMIPTYQDMANSARRNGIIVTAVMAAYRKPDACKHLLVMSSLTEHLEILYRLLLKAGVEPRDFGMYTGKINGKPSTEAQLLAAAERRVILCTDKQTGEGTDFPPWDTIFLCLPWPDVEQRVGRTTRKDEDRPGKIPRVFDFLDSDGMFQSFFKARENYYARVKAKVTRVRGG